MANCIICGSRYEAAETCSVCGFRAYIPTFLNAEQHRRWCDSIVLPALESWQVELQKKAEAELERICGNSSAFAAAGLDFHVLVNQDGTVALDGSTGIMMRRAANESGVRAAAPGNSHIILLKNDGTLKSYGKNSVGQCDVKDWEDVSAIAASGDTTIAVTSGGGLLSAGAGTIEIDALFRKIQESGFAVKAAGINRTQIAVHAEKDGQDMIFFGFYRDSFRRAETVQIKAAAGVKLSCNTGGCYMLADGVVSAIDNESRSALYADFINSIGKAEQVASGQNAVFALMKSGEIAWAGSADRFMGEKSEKRGIVFYSGTLELPLEDAQKPLNIAVLGDDSVLVAIMENSKLATIKFE